MTEGKSPEQVGAKEHLDTAGNNENKKDTRPNGIKNECDGMVSRIWEKMWTYKQYQRF
jgi:hypothetical protein